MSTRLELFLALPLAVLTVASSNGGGRGQRRGAHEHATASGARVAVGGGREWNEMEVNVKS
jgi:hypothetical protein